MGPQEGYSPRTVRDVLWDVYYDLIPLITANLLWAVFTLLVVTAFPAAAGLSYSANLVAKGKSVDWHTFFEGFKEYLGYSYKWGFLTLFVYFVLGVAVWFYSSIDAGWAIVLTALSFAFLILWTIVQLFALPLVFEQVEKSLKMALRNSLVLFIKRPLQTFGLLLGIAVILAVSIILPPLAFIISAALIAYFTNKNMLKSLRIFREQAEEAAETGAEAQQTIAEAEQAEAE